jgi:CBS domain-containing protein
MTEPAVAADPSTPVEVAAELMARHRVKRLPIVHEGRLVGIVSRSDLVRAYARGDGELRREIVEDVLEGRLWLGAPAISCSVAQGVVTLTGRLPRRSQLAIVDDAVRRVPGVVDVDTSAVAWAVDA